MKGHRSPEPSVLIFCSVLIGALALNGMAQVPPGLTERTTTEFGGRHSIAGTVLLPNGSSPTERIRIRLVSPGRDVSTTTDESGRFFVSGLPDGGYTIYVEPPEKYQPQSENIEISSNRMAGGQTFTVQFRLRENVRTATKPPSSMPIWRACPNERSSFTRRRAHVQRLTIRRERSIFF